MSDFLKRAALRTETFEGGGAKLTLRELTLQQRRAILEAGDAPTEAVAALTVAMSCPDFTEDDITTLVEEVRPDILIAAGQRVFELSGMIEGAREAAKKRSESQQKENSSFSWLWRWVAPFRS